MIIYVLLLSTCSAVFAHYTGIPPSPSRHKRDAVGALDIINNADGIIHAELRPENTDGHAVTDKSPSPSRHRRDAVGALDIITNAERIHAEVKPENTDGTAVTDKPCPKNNNLPSSIEMGTVFQVTPPKGAVFAMKSLRKSWPLTNRLDVVRSITRVVTLSILLLSAAIEFYPLIQHLYSLYYL